MVMRSNYTVLVASLKERVEYLNHLMSLYISQLFFAISAANLFKSLVYILQSHNYHGITFTVCHSLTYTSDYRILNMLAGLLLMLFASGIRPSPID